MQHALLSQLVTDATAELDTLKKSRKGLETAVMRVQPLLNKYVTEGHARKDAEFKVCTLGPSCCKRGGIELLADMKKMAEAHPEARVVESECLRRCGRGPNVEVGGIVYTGMNAERARQLMETQLNSKVLAVDLLVDDEFAPEAVVAEEKRVRHDQTLQRARELFVSLEAQITGLSASLPHDPPKKVLLQVLLMQAMKLHLSLKEELAGSDELLKKVVPLNAFVDRIFAREFETWQKAQ